MSYRPRLPTCPDEYRSPLAFVEMNVEEMRPLTYVGGFVEGCLERIAEYDLEVRKSSASSACTAGGLLPFL